jgi:hypothetical protein
LSVFSWFFWNYIPVPIVLNIKIRLLTVNVLIFWYYILIVVNLVYQLCAWGNRRYLQI